MTHIFLVDDMAGKAKQMILALLECHAPDIKVHFIAIVPEREEKTTEMICNKFKNDFENGVHYHKSTQTKDSVYTSKPITYRCNPKHFYNSEDENDVTKAIFNYIKLSANGEPFAVAVDMLLLGDSRAIDNQLIKSDPAIKMLSHSICKEYLGRCGVFSSVPEAAANANFDKWNTILENPHNKEVPFKSTHDTTRDLSKFLMKLFNMANNYDIVRV